MLKIFFLFFVYQQISNCTIALATNVNRIKRNDPFTTSSSEDYIFSLPDIITDFKNEKGDKIKLEAFKTKNNDAIINGKLQEKYGQLQWVSLGHPSLLPIRLNEYFEWSNQHLYAKISMLTDEHICILKRKIQSKYRQLKSEDSIENNQIVDMPISEFKCKLKLECSDNEIILNGHVKNFKEYPLTLYFNMDKFKTYKKCIETSLFNETLDHVLDCQVAQKVKLGKRNMLIIAADHETKLDLVNEIFGTAEYKYVTRNQLGQLSTQLMSNLGIYEEFEFDDEMDYNYIRDEILKQTSTEIFKSVPISEAFSLLSPFNINQDIRPDVITSELSKVLKVTKNGKKEHIIVDKENFNKYMQQQSNELGIRIKGGYGPFGIEGAVNKINEKENQNENLEKNLNEQLIEINDAQTNDVVFEQEGEKIIPKSVKVAKLSKAQFNKKLTFSKIKQRVEVTKYVERFTLIARLNKSSQSISCRKIANLVEEFGWFFAY